MQSLPKIFVVGNSRSGTTMLGRVLGSHSAVHTFDELQYFERLVDAQEMRKDVVLPRARLVTIGNALVTAIREGLFAKVDPDAYRAEVEALIATHNIDNALDLYDGILGAETAAKGKTITCEQTPRYLFVTKELLTAYPEARIVHIYRDPRDVLLSQKNRWRRGFLAKNRMPLIWILRSWSNYHPYLTTRIWASAMRHAAGLRSEVRFMEIRYEALLESPEENLRALCDHLGIAYEPQLLQVEQIGSSTQRDKTAERGFDRSRIGNWQGGGLSQAEITICEQTAGDVMDARGYEASGIQASAPVRWLVKAALLPKGLAALALNITRFRGLSRVIMRRI